MLKHSLALGAIVTLVAGCAGGSGTQSLPAVPAAAQQKNATVAITIGGSSVKSVGRSAKYVSPSTKGASVTVTAAGATSPTSSAVVDLSSTSSACTANTDGSRTCSIAISAPIGSDAIAFALYDGAPVGGAPSGALLSSTTFTAAIVSGTNAIKVTPNGVIASLALALANPTPTVGAASTIAVTVTAQDADGNVIIGSDPYTTPVTLVSSDTSGAVSFSSTSITAPGQTVTLTYSGAEIPKATITASASGVANAATVAFTPLSSRPSIAGDTYTVVTNTTNTNVNPIGSTPVVSQSASQAQVTLLTGASYDGKTGLIQQHSVRSSGNAYPSTIDFYFQRTAVSGRLGVYQVGYVQNAANQYGPAGSTIAGQSRLEDELPETAGDAWTASSAYTGTFYAHPTNTNNFTYDVSQNILADGTIAVTASYPNYNEHTTFQQNPDGTATYTNAYANGITPIATYAVGAPNGATIPITRSYTVNTPVNGSSPAPAPSPTTYAAKNWYPGGVAGAYDTIAEKNIGVVALPADCLLNTVTGTASALVQNETLLDVTGSIYTLVTSFYSVPGIGVVCTVADTSSTSYYNYDNGVGATDDFSGNPTRSSTSHQVSSLQQSSLLSLMRRPLGLNTAILVQPQIVRTIGVRANRR